MAQNGLGRDVFTRHTYHTAELVPAGWLHGRPPSQFSVYNPAIVRFRDRLLMAYRVDFGYEKPFRVAIAICELDEYLQVVPGSVVALSDMIRCPADNHYDPRFLHFGDRLFVHFNNDWNTVPNQLFLTELDPATLQPRSAARVLEVDGPRQPCEKNWLLFEHAGEPFAVYQVAPHIVLRLELAGAGPVRCRPAFRTEWDTTVYTRFYGELRGGAPPVRVGDRYVTLFHSRVTPSPVVTLGAAPVVRSVRQNAWLTAARRWLRETFAPVRYYGGVYAFAAEPPFAPRYLAPEPLLRPEHEAGRRRSTASHMAPRRVVYPCGLVQLNDDRWLVSYGVHDERAVLRVFTRQEIAAGIA